MTNGAVCFAVMLFPRSAVEINGTSPIRADNDFIPHCSSVERATHEKSERLFVCKDN